MTVHTQTLPVSVLATVESKAFYFTSLLYDLHKSDRFLLTQDAPMIAPVTMRFGDAADGTVRCIYSVSYSMDPIYVTSTVPLWGNVLPFANATIPARYL